ncbi:MAG: bifunctional riboflavin kinase/FAD synthetase [Gemmatimonadota bacterium]
MSRWNTPGVSLPGTPPLPRDGRGAVVTVGTFDGVHRGHQGVLQEIQERARSSGRRSVLLTFHPHPLEVVRPGQAPLLLTTPEEKKEAVAESGLEYAIFLAFTPDLAAYPPERFVEEILVERLQVSELVIGYDHGFGRGREGDPDTLRELGQTMGFTVDVVPPVSVGGWTISSSSIRDAIQGGDLPLARAGLGRPYSLRGWVVRGEGRGRKLGFATANLKLPHPRKLLPPPGIYAVWGVLREGRFAGALHLGPRPTFRGSPPSVELHLMDFAGDIYGREVRVDFVRFLRPIIAFPTAAALVKQMDQDVREAAKVLESDV